jgi:hypothetical protein
MSELGELYGKKPTWNMTDEELEKAELEAVTDVRNAGRAVVDAANRFDDIQREKFNRVLKRPRRRAGKPLG